jgi:hypothetical protein
MIWIFASVALCLLVGSPGLRKFVAWTIAAIGVVVFWAAILSH